MPASSSKTVLLFALGFVAATFMHAWSMRRWAGSAAPLVASIAALIAIFVLRRARTWQGLALPCAALAGLMLGLARFEAALPSGGAVAAPPTTDASYVGRLAAEPKVTLKGAILTMDRVLLSKANANIESGVPSRVEGDGETDSIVEPQAIDGTMQLFVSLPPDAEVGDTLSWRCRVFLPDESADAVASLVPEWRCSPRSLPVLAQRNDSNAFSRSLIRLKNGIRKRLRLLIPEPDASFVLGLLVGDTGGVPRDIVQDFRATGTSHVLAVSGYNVSLVSNFAFVFFAFCLLRRRWAAVAVAAFVTFFALLAGGGAPVVRAALMGGVSVAAALAGRRNAGWRPLIFAAALLLAHDPLLMANDVGFRLSFAAVAGMRAFGTHFSRWLAWLPEAFGLRGACAETLSATAATLPLELHDFGTLPIAALPVNMAIVPLVAFATAVGALTLLAGSVWLPLGWPFALVTGTAARAMRLFAVTGNALAPAWQVQVSTPVACAMGAALVISAVWLDRRHAHDQPTL